MSKLNNVTLFKGLRKAEINRTNGVAFFYKTVKKKGTADEEIRYNACVLSGDAFSSDDLFEVWKNTISLYWNVKKDVNLLREDCKGIASNLKGSHPYAIVIYKNGCKALEWCSATSVMYKVGVIPTKKELELSNRDFKKYIHKAAVASFKALEYSPKIEGQKDTTINNDVKTAV